MEDRILPVEETDRGEVAVAEDRVTFEFNKLLICKCGSTCEWRPQEREIRINLRVEAVGDSWVEYVWLTHGILGDKSGWRAALIDQDLVKLEKPGEPRQDVDEWTEWEEQGRELRKTFCKAKRACERASVTASRKSRDVVSS